MNVLAFALLLLSGATTSLRDTSDGASPKAAESEAGTKLLAVLEELDRKVGAIRDVTASFEEHKFTSLLKKPLVSRGVVRAKGAVALWETVSPHRSVVALDRQRIRIFYPDRNALEVYDLSAGGQDRTWMNCLPIPKLDQLKETFTIRPFAPGETDSGTMDAKRHVCFSLIPKDESLSRYIERVDVVVDRRTAVAVRAELTDADGDRTVIEFSDVELNKGLTDRDVELVVPPDVTESHPLGKGR